MYSVVMMAAFAANGPDAIDFARKYRAARFAVGYADPYWGAVGPARGYWGGDNGYGVHGCYGVVAYGQYGAPMYHGYSSCFGLYGGTACYGGCYGSCLGCIAHTAGCYGGCYGQPIWYGPGPAYHPAGNPMVAPPAAKPNDPPKAAEKAPGAAKLILDIPAQAKLYVDDLPMTGTDTTRFFRTPELIPGQTYYYNVRVEATRDGQPTTESRRVLVRAGETVRESFNTASPGAVVSK